MPQGVLVVLQGSLAISLVSIAGLYNLKKYAQNGQRLVLLLALIVAATASLLSVYFWLPLISNSQLFDAVTALIAAISSFVLLVFLATNKKYLIKNAFFYWTGLIGVSAVSFFFALDIISYFNRAFTANAILTTDLITRLSFAFLVGLLPLALILSSEKLVQRDDLALYFKLAIGLGLISLFIRSTTVALQMFLVLGQLPATPFLFNLISTLINQTNLSFYLIIACFFSIAFVSLLKKPRILNEVNNPAEARKVKAFKRHIRRWASFGFTISLVIVLFIFVNQSVANKGNKLSEAKPVTAKGTNVVLNTKELKDKNLRRYSFLSSEGTKVRFLAIYKGAGIYTTVLDVCQICGATGYYQKGDDIICIKCNSIINKSTVGFPGGCNPIPVASKVKNGQVVIKVSDLEKQAEAFK